MLFTIKDISTQTGLSVASVYRLISGFNRNNKDHKINPTLGEDGKKGYTEEEAGRIKLMIQSRVRRGQYNRKKENEHDDSAVNE